MTSFPYVLSCAEMPRFPYHYTTDDGKSQVREAAASDRSETAAGFVRYGSISKTEQKRWRKEATRARSAEVKMPLAIAHLTPSAAQELHSGATIAV